MWFLDTRFHHHRQHYHHHLLPWLASRLPVPSESRAPMKRQPPSVQWYRFLRSRRYARVPSHSVRGSSCILFYLPESVIESVASFISNHREPCLYVCLSRRYDYNWSSFSFHGLGTACSANRMFVSSRFRVFYLIHACPRCVYSRNNGLLVKFRIQERDVRDVSSIHLCIIPNFSTISCNIYSTYDL